MACDCITNITKLIQREGYYYNRYSIANDATNNVQTGREPGGIVNITQFGNWKVPGNSDFGTLFNYLGGAPVAGGKMKSASFWNAPNTGGTGSANLTFRPTGFISIIGGGSLGTQGNQASIWSGGTGTPTTRTYKLDHASAAVISSNSANPRNLQSIRFCRDLIQCESDYDDYTFIDNAYLGNDGNLYSAVKIGSQVWLASNIAETKYNNGLDIYQPIDNTDWLSQSTSLGMMSKGDNFLDTSVSVEITGTVNDCTDEPCQCIKLDWESAVGSFPTEFYNLESLGTINGRNYYEFDTPTYSNTLRLYWRIDPGVPGGYPITPYWVIADSLDLQTILGILEFDSLCPSGTNLNWNGFGSLLIGTESATCACNIKEERIKKEYQSIKLPSVFMEDDRGNKDCCCEYMVLGNAGSESWKSDITSAWIKASSPSDLIEFKLIKGSQSILLTKTAFPNDPNAFYTTIEWKDILSTYGVGCYELKIGYAIAGIVGNLDWGTYNLDQFSIQNAINTARIRVKYNGYHEVDQIDFSGTDIEDSLRFYGYIGNRQPNTEIDNIIYENREMKRVIRENLNTYEIITDPSHECIIKPLVDRLLLSENELYISDYNAHNHSYRYEDLPVIVSESPKIDYYDWSRKAKLSCQVSDKFKNKRTYY
jgi:hypothetical protein